MEGMISERYDQWMVWSVEGMISGRYDHSKMNCLDVLTTSP